MQESAVLSNKNARPTAVIDVADLATISAPVRI
jgi:hypothetical protein